MASTRPDPQRLNALQLLHERATDHGRELARALGQAQAQHAQALQQLHNLHAYAAQYRSQLAALEAAGGAWVKVREMRAFIARIDAAQTVQREEIARIEAMQAQRSREWADARQQEKAFEMLIGKHREAVRGYENHRFMQEIQDWSNQTSSAASSAASGRV
jgi:flagellar export protein FliJ